MDYAARKNQGLLGLDVGTSSFKLVWINKDANALNLLGAVTKDLPKISDISVTKDEKPVFVELLKSAVAELGCSTRKVFVCLSGPNLHTRRISLHKDHFAGNGLKIW